MDPYQSDEAADRLRDDLLRGAGEIAAYLTELLRAEITPDDVYFYASGRSKAGYPIGRLGRGLPASKRALGTHVRKSAITRPPANAIARSPP